MLRTPNALFEGSKAYSINYGVMRKIKPEVWSKAFNDPTWIRDVFKLMLTLESFDWPTGLTLIRESWKNLKRGTVSDGLSPSAFTRKISGS